MAKESLKVLLIIIYMKNRFCTETVLLSMEQEISDRINLSEPYVKRLKAVARDGL
jgi:hypothetical protein